MAYGSAIEEIKALHPLARDIVPQSISLTLLERILADAEKNEILNWKEAWSPLLCAG